MANKKRFTFLTDDYHTVTCDSCYEDQNEYYTGPAIERLAEYEATGLMPAEVAALAQELKYAKQQCREERRWIPVTERLPDIGIEVLVYSEDDGVCVDYYGGDSFGYYDVTHWMPLPEPPKGE